MVMGQAYKLAREMNFPLSVVVFDPHPRRYFNPDQDEFCLTSFRTKAHLLENFGVDNLFVLSFDKKIAQLAAQDFVTDILIKNLGARHIFVGYDYRFGVGRSGTASLLQQMGKAKGFGVTIVEKVMAGDQIYSSTNIRDFLKKGDVRRSADQLGHWWHVEGHVLHGDQRGRSLDFPTANLSMAGYIKPKLGVYAVRVIIAVGPAKGLWHGAANLGNRPTFNKNELMLEAHIFDFEHDIYGLPIKVEFVDFIRPEQKFDGLDSLKQQIAKDCLRAKEILADPQNQQKVIPIPRGQDYL